MSLVIVRSTAASSWEVAPWHAGDCRHRGQALLDAQLWCLGRDILHPEGNLLVAHGAVRTRDGLLPRQPTAYRHESADGTRVALWGYGLWLGDARADVGCFVRRKGFAPLLTGGEWPSAGAFARDDRPARRARDASELARLVPLTVRLARWCVAYESWIAATVPAEWRATCEAERPRPARRRRGAHPADALLSGWAHLGDALARWPSGVGGGREQADAVSSPCGAPPAVA